MGEVLIDFKEIPHIHSEYELVEAAVQLATERAAYVLELDRYCLAEFADPVHPKPSLEPNNPNLRALKGALRQNTLLNWTFDWEERLGDVSFTGLFQEVDSKLVESPKLAHSLGGVGIRYQMINSGQGSSEVILACPTEHFEGRQEQLLRLEELLKQNKTDPELAGGFMHTILHGGEDIAFTASSAELLSQLICFRSLERPLYTAFCWDLRGLQNPG